MSNPETKSLAEQHLEIEIAYRNLVAAFGGGFHPDTRGDDYESLPAGITAEQYETIVEATFAAGLDAYGLALDEIHLIDLAASETGQYVR